MNDNKNNITINDVIDKFKLYDNNIEDIELINKAYDYAYKKHFGVKRISGDDYIIHPLNVAMILTDINADAACMAAALLHDTIEDDDTKEEIEELFKDYEKHEIKVGSNLLDLLIDIKAANSKREAREFVTGNAVSINGEKVTDLDYVISEEDFIDNKYIIIRRGKKNYYIGVMC